MATERFSNNGRSSLVSGINGSATSLQVQSAASFPTAAQFRILIDSEIMLVTGVSGATFTVTRAQEGTVAADHAAGAEVFQPLTAGAIAQLKEDAIANWKTAVDIDFTAQTPQSLSADGNYSIGGFTWTRFNQSGDATAMAIDATGLVITPAAATDYNGATRNLPGIYLPIVSAIPAFELGYSLRLMAYVSASNNTANYDNAVIGFDQQGTNFGYISKRGHGTGGVGFESFVNVSSANQGFHSRTVTLDGTNNVMVVEVPAAGIDDMWTRYGAYSAGFPTGPNITSARFWRGAAGARDLTGAVASTFSLFLGAQRANSGTSLVIKYARVRLDYKVG